MGIYLNPGNTLFEMSKENDLYVDKSEMISILNKKVRKLDRYICVSRPRRFGKSVDANMLVAYYSKDCESYHLFDHLKIAQCDSYEKHLNQHQVIHLNMQNFLTETASVKEMMVYLNTSILEELQECYSECIYPSLVKTLSKIYAKTKEGFIFVIDEWDCVFRYYPDDKEAHKQYLDYLRMLFKDQPYIDLVYMTGILPIKKYGIHSALNMFKEISVLQAIPFQKYMGFHEDEVKSLCEQYQMNFEDMKLWYDGYQVEQESLYCPRSVVCAIQDQKYRNYWTQTETFDALKTYIDLNVEGLKDDVIKMLSDESVKVDITGFQNDMNAYASKDDIFTLLVHLGYLTYNDESKTVKIPNKEVKDEFATVLRHSDWGITTKAVKNSRDLLDATIAFDVDKIANYLEQAHLETSILQYNDENALAYTLYLAYYSARDYYTLVRELPSGKGFADLVFIPLKNDKPAMIIELKYDQGADTAIKQIKDKKYYFGLEKYLSNLLLVGISYDKQTKKHECIIEKYKD